MSATDELRRMLDERGVEWESDDFSGIDRKVVYQYTYWGDGGGCCFCEPIGAEPGTIGAKCDFSVIGFTPEQAIAATLGAGTCKPEKEHLDSYSDLTVTVCSNCRVAIDDLEDCHYCPNCGARVVSE